MLTSAPARAVDEAGDARGAALERLRVAAGKEPFTVIEADRHECFAARPLCVLPNLSAEHRDRVQYVDHNGFVLGFMILMIPMVAHALLSLLLAALGCALAPCRVREVGSLAVAVTPTRLISTEEVCVDPCLTYQARQTTFLLVDIAEVKDNDCCGGEARIFLKDPATGSPKSTLMPDAVFPCLRDTSLFIDAVDSAVKVAEQLPWETVGENSAGSSAASTAVSGAAKVPPLLPPISCTTVISVNPVRVAEPRTPPSTPPLGPTTLPPGSSGPEAL